MAFTPDDIRLREFYLADRGYDRSEVRAFLAALGDQVSLGGARASADHLAPTFPEVEERLLLVLDAARRAIDAVRDEATRAIGEVRAAVVADAPSPTAPAESTAPDVGGLRQRLATALQEVEAALGAIGPGSRSDLGQLGAPSTRPNS